jgi:hypothetical protein
MGAKVDHAATTELNRLNALLKTASDNRRQALQAIQAGVDKQTAQFQQKLAETQRLMAKVKTKLNAHTKTLSDHHKQLEVLKKQQKQQ